MTRFVKCGITRVGKSQNFMNPKSFFATPILIFAVVLFSNFAFAYTADNPAPTVLPFNPVNRLTNLKTDLFKGTVPSQNINTSVPTLPSLPNLNNLKNFLPKGGSNGSIKTSSTKSFSTSDVGGGLKSIGVLAIRLFLIVIETVAAVLRALLPFLSR